MPKSYDRNENPKRPSSHENVEFQMKINQFLPLFHGTI